MFGEAMCPPTRLRICAPRLSRAFQLQPDDEHDPDVLRLGLSQMGLPEVRVAFATSPVGPCYREDLCLDGAAALEGQARHPHAHRSQIAGRRSSRPRSRS